jgi:hypothetical protein
MSGGRLLRLRMRSSRESRCRRSSGRRGDPDHGPGPRGVVVGVSGLEQVMDAIAAVAVGADQGSPVLGPRREGRTRHETYAARRSLADLRFPAARLHDCENSTWTGRRARSDWVGLGRDRVAAAVGRVQTGVPGRDLFEPPAVRFASRGGHSAQRAVTVAMRERPAGHLTRACAGPGRLERHKQPMSAPCHTAYRSVAAGRVASPPRWQRPWPGYPGHTAVQPPSMTSI